MANVTFSGASKEIWINPGVTEINVKIDLYSDWKEWLTSDPANLGWAQAFRSVGGDTTAAGQYSPQYFFLMNGWKIVIDGNTNPNVDFALNLYVDGGGDPFIKINGATVSNLRSDAAVVESVISNRLDYNGRVIYDIEGYSGSTYPIGTGAYPVNNCSDLKEIMMTYGFHHVELLSNIILTDSFSGVLFTSHAGLRYVDVNGQDVDGSFFDTLAVYGDFANSQTVLRDCYALSCYRWHGIMNNCHLGGITQFSNVSSSTLSHCVVAVPNFTEDTCEHTFDLSLGSKFNFRSGSGEIQIVNMTHPDDYAEIDIVAGRVTILPSCIAGEIDVRGMASLTNESLGTEVETDGLWDTTKESVKLSEALGLSQSNFKMTNQTYTVSGSLSTCIIKTYPTAIDLNLNTNVLATYNVNATYDSSGLLNSYSVTKQ